MRRFTRRRCLTASISASLSPALLSAAAPHEKYMRRAIALAAHTPQFPFGALLVDTAKDQIVAEGWNKFAENPTYHGEMDAIHNCARTHRNIDWSRLTLYTTAEPCPMCQSAVAWSGISAVVYGSSIPFLQSLAWPQIDIRAAEVIRRTQFGKCSLLGGVLEKECNALFRAAVQAAPQQKRR